MKNKYISLIEKGESAKAPALNKSQSELIKQPSERKIPEVTVGDTVVVTFWIELGEKGRTQVFEGTIIAIKGEKPDERITVRKIVQGEGVERIFPLSSPRLAKIEVKRGGKTRRAKLYYLRKRVGKATRLKEKKKAGPVKAKAKAKA
jgi:large subunit ribosomal protein L19